MMANIFQWIILISLLGVTYAKHTDCERPPTIDHATVSMEDHQDVVTARYTCANGYVLKGESEITCDLDSDEWLQDPPTCERSEQTSSELGEAEGGGGRKKKKGQEIQEDTGITSEFAMDLDLSCMGRTLVRAPNIANGYVVKYNRRKKDGNIFLVAFYECDDEYDLVVPENDHLYCSKQTWIGNTPSCAKSSGGEYDEEVEGEPYEEEDYADREEGEAEGANDFEEHFEQEHSSVVQTASQREQLVEEQRRLEEERLAAEKLRIEEQERYAAETRRAEEERNAIESQRRAEEERIAEEQRRAEEMRLAEERRLAEEQRLTEERNRILEAQKIEEETQRSEELKATEARRLAEEEARRAEEEARNLAEEARHAEERARQAQEEAEQREKEASLAEEEARHADAVAREAEEAIFRKEITWKVGAEGSFGHENSHQQIEESENFVEQKSIENKENFRVGEQNRDEIEREIQRSNFDRISNQNIDKEIETDTEEEDYRKKNNNQEDTERFSETNERRTHMEVTKEEVLVACGADRGGCDHECRMVQFTNELEPRVQCSCFAGFTLDPSDGRTCHDIDECQNNNGGCEQICRNVPGSFECSCESGLQIDTVTGNTCIDINECEHPEISQRCPYGCENLPGSWRCLEEQVETMVHSVQETHPSEVETFIPTEPCNDGFRKDQRGECVDIDECAEGSSGCQFCQNAYGGFECTCPDGYELKDDERTCQDINECEAYNEFEEGQIGENSQVSACSHQCVNLEGSFKCLCPESHHLHSDLRTCVPDFCGDLTNPEFNKKSCSHDCVDTQEGFSCKCPSGHKLDTDLKTCLTLGDSCESENGHKYCQPGTCLSQAGQYRCVCPGGFEEKHGRCHDIDECDAGHHGCSHSCRNTAGSYECSCPPGYVLSEDSRTCVDKDECLENSHDCGSLLCQNTVGSYKCTCPAGQEILPNGTCGVSNPCTANNGGCSHTCNSHNVFIECGCPAGMILKEDDKTCVEFNPCLDNNGGCSQICDNRLPQRCACNAGYELSPDGQTCVDCDECAVDNGGCSQMCVNKPAVSCPRLTRPEHGTILPQNCMLGEILAGQRCVLHCAPGFKPAGKRATVCNIDSTWSADSSLYCIPVDTAPEIIRPFIKCPQDTLVILPKGQNTVHIKLEQPKTNVDFNSMVDAHPEWAKFLEAHFGPGVHVLTFRARSPGSNLQDICRTIITVKHAQPPVVAYCPSTLDVQLNVNEEARSVTWKEPVFQTHGHLKQVYKSQIPGDRFAAGVHHILYVAADKDGQSSRCEFKIIVRPPQLTEDIQSSYKAYEANRLENHVSYLLCPGKEAMRIETSYPLHIPVGCYIKNVRIYPHIRYNRKRHRRIHGNNILRHYSSWNNPNIQAANYLSKSIMNGRFGW